MRIAFLVNRDIESNLVLNLLLPELHDSVVGVFVSERVGGKASPPPMLGQLGFIEQELFNNIVFPLIEHVGSVGFESFSGLARRYGIPVRTISTLKDPASRQPLAEAGADLLVSIRFGVILGAEAIAIPPLGVLNLHSGLLPEYRGVLATFRALLNRDSQIGCTLHWIDSPGIDAGPIIELARVTVDPERSLLWHVLSLYRPGAQLILDAIRSLEKGEQVHATPQDPASGGYYSFPTHEDLVRFTAMGWRLFDRRDVQELLDSYISRDA